MTDSETGDSQQYIDAVIEERIANLTDTDFDTALSLIARFEHTAYAAG